MNKLEEFLNKDIQEWTEIDLKSIFKALNEENKDIQDALKDPAIISEVLSKSSNNVILEQFEPLKVSIKHHDAMIKANNIIENFNENKVQKSETIKLLDELMNSEDLFERFAAYLVVIALFTDYDLQSKENKVKDDTDEFKETICKFSADKEYTLLTDLFDECFALRNYYFNKYKVDILDDSDQRLKEALNQYNTVTKIINDAVTAICDPNNGKEKKE